MEHYRFASDFTSVTEEDLRDLDFLLEQEATRDSCREKLAEALKHIGGAYTEIRRLEDEREELYQLVEALFALARECPRKELLMRRYRKLEAETEDGLPVAQPTIPRNDG